MKIFNVFKYFFNALKEGGFIYAIKLACNFILRNVFGIDNRQNDFFNDVLFINGCTLPHPTRYRVDHQVEQLRANNIFCSIVFYEDLTLEMLKYSRAFVFYRCPYTELIGDFIGQAKALNKPVLFDIDDLVIDKEYTDKIKYLKTLTIEQKANYDDGVERMKKTLMLCDAAITTTSTLANELKKYVDEVFVNRNTASLEMVEISNEVSSTIVHDESKIKLGYFSGSITHNDDFMLILPVLKRLMNEYKNLFLYIVGELDIPKELQEYKSRIIAHKFTNWRLLPKLIASVDINLSPLENTIFNEAKSENKWIEASLVKVPTVASNIGAFKEMIENTKTGYLCSTEEDWYNSLKLLIDSKEQRRMIAEKAYEKVIAHNTTIYSGFSLSKYIKSKMSPNIAFVLPSTNVSGGVNVIVRHCMILQKRGYDVFLINNANFSNDIITSEGRIPAISGKTHIVGKIDKGVATLWSTLDDLLQNNSFYSKYYLVQNFETDFYEFGHPFKIQANSTYNHYNVNYLTISQWCKNWLLDTFEKQCRFAPNGINLNDFKYRSRNFDGKIRILIEGNSDDYYKNVDESFKIVQNLDKEKFEIWYLSYQGKPKDWYKVDKFLHKVPYKEVGKIYGECHILLKSSRLESFSYPPLEMMATGGIAVVAPNGGNVEYLKDKENCLFYPVGDIQKAVANINEICNNQDFRETLIANGLETAKNRSWDLYENTIASLYD
jgi:glycosyltransferase involved in cell wall biosynthesis